MNLFKYFTLLLISVIFSQSLFAKEKLVVNNDFIQNISIDKDRFIAHAAGAINTDRYTNSLEALNHNYKKGFRLFEIDIIKTSDNIIVAAHDWKYWKKITKYNGTVPPIHEVFKKLKLMGKYSPIDIVDINNWFKLHPDAILVTDKINTPSKFIKEFKYPQRLIMELFSWDAVDEALKQNILGVMPTYSIIRHIKGDKIAYLKNKGISYISVSRKHLQKNIQFFKDLQKNNIKAFAFHVNQSKEFDETYMVCNELKDFYGIYADNWDFPSNFNLSNCTIK